MKNGRSSTLRTGYMYLMQSALSSVNDSLLLHKAPLFFQPMVFTVPNFYPSARLDSANYPIQYLCI